jgi:hypothetical protein
VEKRRGETRMKRVKKTTGASMRKGIEERGVILYHPECQEFSRVFKEGGTALFLYV